MYKNVLVPDAPNITVKKYRIDGFMIEWSSSVGATAYDVKIKNSSIIINGLNGTGQIFGNETEITGLTTGRLYNVVVTPFSSIVGYGPPTIKKITTCILKI